MDKAQRREWLVYALNRPLAFAVLEIAGWLGAIVRVPRVGHVVSDAEIGRRVLTDTEHFDSHSPGSLGTLVTQVLGPFALLNMDGVEHHELKRRLMDVFSPKYIAALLSAATGRLVTELHEHLRAGQTVDFVEFMTDFASVMACELIGVKVPSDRKRERAVFA
jgi:cytochrome P450